MGPARQTGQLYIVPFAPKINGIECRKSTMMYRSY